MSTTLRRILLIVLPLAVFLAVGIYDAGQRATRLQNGAHMTLDACESIAEQAGQNMDDPNSACLVAFRSALDASSTRGMIAALPLALGSAAGVLILLLLVLRRRRETPEAL
jgi:hypothetical protein